MKGNTREENKANEHEKGKRKGKKKKDAGKKKWKRKVVGCGGKKNEHRAE